MKIFEEEHVLYDFFFVGAGGPKIMGRWANEFEWMRKKIEAVVD